MISFFKEIYLDAKNIKEKDPAAKSIISIILLYPGIHAVISHRITHFLYKRHLFFIARALSHWKRKSKKTSNIKK